MRLTPESWELRMKTVFVTGAGGYIGSVLTPKLLRSGYRVRAVDRFFFGRDKLAPATGLEVIQEDTRRLTDEHLRGIDYVIDLAAISNDPAGELFGAATEAINCDARVATAERAKRTGVKRYILPSSCSIYGVTDDVVDESSPTNPLTTYSRANEKAEQAVLSLADESFVVTVMRQATVFGYSPRMRFDLAINGMTYGAWKGGKLPLMRDGSQYRPMVHIEDTTDVMLLLLESELGAVNGQIFNVGSVACSFQIEKLGQMVARVVSEITGSPVQIEWYGDPDRRSYRVAFDKIETALGWKARWSGEDGVRQIVDALRDGRLEKGPETITLEWYRDLHHWHRIIRSVEMYGSILDIE
jgi:nucleoside-diphosphate-sugar epimerase